MSAAFAQSDCNKDNWQEYYNSEGRDMTECDLSEADLSGANLYGANLRGADLEGANLYSANLEGANLSGANVRWADLRDANLDGAIFTASDCSKDNWQEYYNSEGRDMTDCDLSQATLGGADLTNANLTIANLRGADLKKGNLTGANLENAYLTDANLTGAYLTGADLIYADLVGANLENADLTDANLIYADLNGANLDGAIFTQSDCNKDNWQEYYNSLGRDMTECDLSEADLSGANLYGANLRGADLKYANLSGATLYSANLENADLTGANLEGVISSAIRGVPDNLPEGWSLVDGTLELIKEAKRKAAKRAQQEAAQKAAAAKITADDDFSEFIPEGYNLNQKYFADFNKDGNDDCVLVVKAKWRDNVLNRFGDSVDRNRRGIIILLKDNKGYKLVEKNLDCFSSENEDGGVYFPPQLSIITKKGILIIEYDHGRYGNWKYTFRYQEEAFKLIGYDIKEMHFLDYWLQSINFLSKKKFYSSKEEGVLKEDWSNFTIDKLITLSEIENFDVGYNEQILNIIKDGKYRDVAVISTQFGDMVVEFYPDIAPMHVESFTILAKEGYFDGTTFHRLIPGFLIQGGDPNSKDDNRMNDGTGGRAGKYFGIGRENDPDTWLIPGEFNDKLHVRGTLSMARTHSIPNSASSQFFVCHAAAPQLDKQYTVFAQVIKGLEVIDKIVNANRPKKENPSYQGPDGDNPYEKIEMTVKMMKHSEAIK